jgi:hypothetical protein
VNYREISYWGIAGLLAAGVRLAAAGRACRSTGCCAIFLAGLHMQGLAARELASGTTAIDQPALETPTVTIEGHREQIAHEIRSFVYSFAVNDSGEPLARWQTAVCPMVAGLPKDRGEAVFRHISEIVADAGVPPGGRDCRPNLLILVTPNPEASLQELWAENPGMMIDDRGRAGIERFIHGTQPIRAWHNACSEAPTSAKGPRTGVRCTGSTIGSLLSFESIRSIYSGIVVVDQERTGELTDRQLASYAAMIALVQTRDTHIPRVPTILRLFNEPDLTKPQGLSNWDSAFLKALYSVNPGDVGQLAEIASAMQRQLVP